MPTLSMRLALNVARFRDPSAPQHLYTYSESTAAGLQHHASCLRFLFVLWNIFYRKSYDLLGKSSAPRHSKTIKPSWNRAHARMRIFSRKCEWHSVGKSKKNLCFSFGHKSIIRLGAFFSKINNSLRCFHRTSPNNVRILSTLQISVHPISPS